jgi:hypothetical protein
MKKVALYIGGGLLGLWLLLVVLSNLHPAKTEAKPAPARHTQPLAVAADKAKPEPVVRWGGITEAQAERLAVRDDYVLDIAANGEPYGSLASYERLLANPTATRVSCGGSKFWKLDYGEVPAPWFESKDVGLSDCQGDLWAAHPARVACARNPEYWNTRASKAPTWFDAKRLGLRCQSEWHR